MRISPTAERISLAGSLGSLRSSENSLRSTTHFTARRVRVRLYSSEEQHKALPSNFCSLALRLLDCRASARIPCSGASIPRSAATLGRFASYFTSSQRENIKKE